MSEKEITKRVFLIQCAAGLTAFATGCAGDDSDDGATTTPTATDTDPTTMTSPTTMTATTSQPTMTATTQGTSTTEPMTTSTTDPDTGSTGDTSGPGTGSSGGGSGCSGVMIVAAISNNHGHSLEIPVVDIEAGIEQTYDATGTSLHCHQVTLTSEDFQTLRDGGVVTKLSCNGTDHEYVLSCAPGAPAPVAPDCSMDPNAGACN